jgi:hypothetical protein
MASIPMQRLRSVLSEAGNIAIPPPAQKTFDAEGEVLERRFRDATIKEAKRPVTEKSQEATLL